MNKGLADPLMLREDIKDIVFTYMAKPGVDVTTPQGKLRLKQEIGAAAANRILDPTAAALAAVYIDSAMPTPPPTPQTTVAQDLFGGVNPAGGLPTIPTQEGMFEQGMAGGGIVAMAGGGDVPRYQNRGSVLSLPANIRSVLDAKIAQLGLDADYVYRAISMAPPEQQRKLLSELGALSQTTPTFEPVRAEDPVPQAAAPMREATGIENIIAKQEVARPKMAEFYSKGFRDLTATFPENYSPEALGQPADTPTSGNPLFDTLGRFGKRVSDAVMYSSDREAAMDRELAKYDPDRGLTGSRTPPATRPMTKEEVQAAVALTGTRRPSAQSEKLASGLGATPEAAASPVTSVKDQAKAMAAEAVKIPAVPTVEEFIKRQSEMDEKMGVDRKFEEKELADITAQKEALKDERSQAANMRLLEMGLAIMGGTSPYAFENIGKGASKALAGFTQDLKDIKKNETELTNLQRQIKRAENQYRRDKSDKNLAELEKLRQRAEDKTQERTKMEMDLELQLEKLGISKEQLRLTKEVAARQGVPGSIQEYELWKSQQPKGAPNRYEDYLRTMGIMSAEAKNPMLARIRKNIEQSGVKGGIRLSEEDAAALAQYLNP